MRGVNNQQLISGSKYCSTSITAIRHGREKKHDKGSFFPRKNEGFGFHVANNKNITFEHMNGYETASRITDRSDKVKVEIGIASRKSLSNVPERKTRHTTRRLVIDREQRR
jgi:hypothetical protein